MKFVATKIVWQQIFFTPLFCCCFWIRDPGSRIWNPGWIKNQDPWWAFRIRNTATKYKKVLNYAKYLKDTPWARSANTWHCMRYMSEEKEMEGKGGTWIWAKRTGQNLEMASFQTKRRVALYQNCREDQSNHTAETLSNRDQRPWHSDIWCISVLPIRIQSRIRSDPELFAGSGVRSGINHFRAGSGQPLSGLIWNKISLIKFTIFQPYAQLK